MSRNESEEAVSVSFISSCLGVY